MEGQVRHFERGAAENFDPAAAERRLFGVAEALIARPFDVAVNEALGILGRGAGADRAWMFRYNPDATLFRNTHEWTRLEVSSHGEDLQDVPTAMIAWLQASLAEGKAVMVEDIEALPRSAKALKAEFRRQRNRSVLSVPLFRDGKLWGCVGYDAVLEAKVWDEDEVGLLFRCGSLIMEAAGRSGWDIGPRKRPGDLTMPTADGNRRVEVREILGVKAERDYTRVYFSGGSSLELRPLKMWLGFLPKEDFQRIHRGAIINVRNVIGTRHRRGGGLSVTVDGLGEEWSVSRPYRAELRSRLGF